MAVRMVFNLLLSIVCCMAADGASGLTGTLPVTTCCHRNRSYLLGAGTCHLDGNPWPLLRVSTHHINPLAKVRVHLIECPLHQTVATSVNFTLFGDGSIEIDGQTLQSGDFCVNPVQLTDGAMVWVARHCVEDPCRDRACFNKCCPPDMAMDATSNTCQFTNEPFNFTLQNKQLVTRAGAVPKCKNDYYLLTPESNREDEFLISADGQLYQPGVPDSLTKDYCLENFIYSDSKSVSDYSMTC